MQVQAPQEEAWLRVQHLQTWMLPQLPPFQMEALHPCMGGPHGSPLLATCPVLHCPTSGVWSPETSQRPLLALEAATDRVLFI